MLQLAAGSKRGPPIPTSRLQLEPCCSNCGCPQSETPVMRKGPTGPLCNSCGCFYVKHRRMRDITKLANVGRGAGNRRKMLEEMRKAQQSGASSHAATPATQGSASGPLANMQAAAAVRMPGGLAHATAAAALAMGPGAQAIPSEGPGQRAASQRPGGLARGTAADLALGPGAQAIRGAQAIPIGAGRGQQAASLAYTPPLAPAMPSLFLRPPALQAATSAAPPVLAPGAKPHAAGVAGPMQPTATPRSPVLRGTAVPAPVPVGRALSLPPTAGAALGSGASMQAAASLEPRQPGVTSAVLPGVPLLHGPATPLPSAQTPAAPGSASHAAVLSQPQTPGSGATCPTSKPFGSTCAPGAPLMQGLPLQVQAIPGSVGSAKVVLQLHAIPNMPAAQSMPASQACQPQRLLPKQPSAPSTPGARLAALAAAAECWDDELTWARRCVSVPVPHTESGDSLADLLADAEFLASIDSQAAAAASSCPDTAVPARERGEGSELRGLFESFSVDELELDWAELEEGVSKLGEACGQSGVAGSSLVASNIGLPSKKGPHTLQAASLPKRCGSNGITATPLVAPGSQPTEDFEILPDVWSTGLGGAAPFEMSSSQQAPGLPPAFPMRPSSDFGPGTPLAAAGSKRPPVGGGFLSGLVRGSDAAGQLPSSQPNEGLSSPAGCSSGLCGSALPLGAQLQPSEVAEIPTEWRAILETGALLSGMHDMLS